MSPGPGCILAWRHSSVTAPNATLDSGGQWILVQRPPMLGTAPVRRQHGSTTAPDTTLSAVVAVDYRSRVIMFLLGATRVSARRWRPPMCLPWISVRLRWRPRTCYGGVSHCGSCSHGASTASLTLILGFHNKRWCIMLVAPRVGMTMKMHAF